MNYATKWLLKAANASLIAWEGEENSVREEHADTIDDLQAAIFYFDAHGDSPKQDEDADEGDYCTACNRLSLDCSISPCEAVIEDRLS